MKKNNEIDYYSTRQAAQKLGINISALMRRIRSGDIKATKMGKWVWAIPKAQIDKLVEMK